MLSKVRIRNMKGIEEATLENLKQVNLLFGKNGGGKTTVLEGIYMLGCKGNPVEILRLNAERGIWGGGGSEEGFMEGQIRHWFHKRQEQVAAVIDGVIDGKRNVEVWIGELKEEERRHEIEITTPEENAKGRRGRNVRRRLDSLPLKITYKGHGDEDNTWRMAIDDGRLLADREGRRPHKTACHFLSGEGGEDIRETAFKLGRLEIEKTDGRSSRSR